MNSARLNGIGMTSQRTRARMLVLLRQQGIKNEAVLDAISAVPRHIFVDEALSHRAYEVTALPIGYGQTISSPYTVARMTEVLFAGGRLNKVLEIGTGCGYQTAVLSHFADEVYSVERISPLLTKARKHLRELRAVNVRLKHDDGCMGLAEMAPFDGIIMTAAATHVSELLLNQLAADGRMILPIGSVEQQLTLIERIGHEYRQTVLEPVRFVPLLSGVA